MCIGVLALQGDFSKHLEMVGSLGVEVQEVRTPQDLGPCRGLIIPGGESTAIVRHIDFIGMREPLLEFAQHKPLFGTCAGLILMSKQVTSFSARSLELLDVVVERNAFGRQAESFQAVISVELEPQHATSFPAFFIRAPRVRQCGEGVRVLASFEGEPVLVRQGHHLGASFHPELTTDSRIHEYFLNLCF